MENIEDLITHFITKYSSSNYTIKGVPRAYTIRVLNADEVSSIIGYFHLREDRI